MTSHSAYEAKWPGYFVYSVRADVRSGNQPASAGRGCRRTCPNQLQCTWQHCWHQTNRMESWRSRAAPWCVATCRIHLWREFNFAEVFVTHSDVKSDRNDTAIRFNNDVIAISFSYLIEDQITVATAAISLEQKLNCIFFYRCLSVEWTVGDTRMQAFGQRAIHLYDSSCQRWKSRCVYEPRHWSICIRR